MGSVSKIYFTKNISSESVVSLYDKLGNRLKGNVAIKVHSGEAGNQNFLRPEFWKPIVEYVGGKIVECNTAYAGERNSSEKHIQLIKKHGWDKYFDVDIMDKDGPDVELPIKRNAKHLKSDIVGKDLMNYDSMLVLSHFKGHPMGGFGGALKQLSIGFGSQRGKTYIHTAGKITATTVEGALAELAADTSDTIYMTDNTSTSGTNYAKIYKIYQGSDSSDMDNNILVGTINIPKDMVVSQGIVTEVFYNDSDDTLHEGSISGIDVTEEIKGTGVDGTAADAGKYIKLTIANATASHLWIKATDLVDTYTGYRGDEPLKELILKIYRFMKSNPFPEEWLEEKVRIFKCENIKDFSNTIWGDVLLKNLREELVDAINSLKSVENELEKYYELEKKFCRYLKSEVFLL